MKVLLVIDGLWVGGTERSMAEMLPLLKKEGIDPILVCLRRRDSEGIEQEVLNGSLDIRFLGGSPIQNTLQLRKIIKEEKPALIHTALLKANFTGRFARIGLPVPILNSLVNTPYEEVRFQDPGIHVQRLRTMQLLDRWTSRLLTNYFHAVSHAAKVSAIKSLGIPEARITVVERGRDPERLGVPSQERRRVARQRLGYSEENRVLVNVGRHDYQKGQIYLLQAIPALLEKHPGLAVAIAGRSGAMTGELKKAAENMGITERVHFLGHYDHVPELLAAADLFVFPSLFEGLPGAVIEAMALGLPVVAFDIPPNREVVEPGKNALLVPAGSAEALSEAIDQILQNDSVRLAFSQRSREIFEERFTLKRSVGRMIELYKRLTDLESTKRVNGNGRI